MLVFRSNFFLNSNSIYNKKLVFNSILVCIDVNEDADTETNIQPTGFEVKVEPEAGSNDTNKTESKIFFVKRKLLLLGYKSVYDIYLAL